MADSRHFIFEAFSQNLSRKLISRVEGLFPGDQKILLVLPQCFELLLNNPIVAHGIAPSRLLISFLEKKEAAVADPKLPNLCFLSTTDPKALKATLAAIAALPSPKTRDFKLHLLFHPRQDVLVRTALHTAKSLSYFEAVASVGDLNLDFIPLDSDLLQFAFALHSHHPIETSILQSRDQFPLQLVLEGLEKFQTVFGQFDFLAAKGPRADRLLALLTQARPPQTSNREYTKTLFPSLLIFDRASDLITPLMTSWVYMGLVDEATKVRFGNVKLPEKLIAAKPELLKDAEKAARRYYFLRHPLDSVFLAIRDLHQAYVKSTLTDITKNVASLNAATVSFGDLAEANRAIDQVTARRYLGLHFDLLRETDTFVQRPVTREVIRFEQEIIQREDFGFIDRLIELVQAQIPLEHALRLLALTNFCLRGFPSDRHQEICRELILSYGPQAVKALATMEELGFFVDNRSPNSYFGTIDLTGFQAYKSKFEIVKEQTDLTNPTDLAVPYAGFTPVSVKIVENLLVKEKNLPKVKFNFAPDVSRTDFMGEATLVVCFLGGVTYGEVACLRRLATRLKKTLLVLTTDLLNSTSLPKVFLATPDEGIVA